MQLNDKFDAFLEKITLGSEIRQSIETAFLDLQRFLKSDSEIKSKFIRLFFHGSYRAETIINSLNDAPAELDLVLGLHLRLESGELIEPEKIIGLIVNRFSQSDSYQSKMTHKGRCIYLKFNNFQFNIVPVHIDANLFLPSEGEPAPWEPTNPEGIFKWNDILNEVSDYKFQKIVKILKRWRDIHCLGAAYIKSLVFVVLIGGFVHRQTEILSESLAITMKDLEFHLRMTKKVPRIEHPADSDENLAKRWSQEEFDAFKEKFHAATKIAVQAYNEKDEIKSVALWRELFGADFPV